MGGCSHETESWVVFGNTFQDYYESQQSLNMTSTHDDYHDDDDDLARQFSKLKTSDDDDAASSSGSSFKSTKKKNQVLLEGYVETDSEDDLKRTKSLTDDDLDELKGCLDLGFGFSYEEIPELCNTLPALELCYSMSQKFMDEHQNNNNKSSDTSPLPTLPDTPVQSPIASWKISSPGDHPEDVKARLKFWAQAVACTVYIIWRWTYQSTGVNKQGEEEQVERMNLSVMRASIRASLNSWRPLYVLRMDGRMNTPFAETTLKGRGQSERRTSANFATLIAISFYYQFYVLGCDGDLTCSCE